MDDNSTLEIQLPCRLTNERLKELAKVINLFIDDEWEFIVIPTQTTERRAEVITAIESVIGPIKPPPVFAYDLPLVQGEA